MDWAVELFRSGIGVSAELQKEIDRLKAIANPEERTLMALRFVQDEIRYLGIESGIGSHQPSAPNEVLRRRFGDGKDKAFLLTALLQGSGIRATPALVSKSDRETIADSLPAPDAFDHAIVRVQLGDTSYWLDATRSNQRGPLRQIYVRNFGQALVIEPGAKALTAFITPRESFFTKEDRRGTISFRAPVRREDWKSFRNTTELRLTRCARLFARVVWMPHWKIIWNITRGVFRKSRFASGSLYRELEGENGCAVSEFYRIPNIWKIDAAANNYEVTLYPGELDQAMGSAVSGRREDPLALEHPVEVTQEFNAAMFEDWPAEAKKRDVDNAVFRFHEEADGKGAHLRFSYSFATLWSMGWNGMGARKLARK